MYRGAQLAAKNSKNEVLNLKFLKNCVLSPSDRSDSASCRTQPWSTSSPSWELWAWRPQKWSAWRRCFVDQRRGMGHWQMAGAAGTRIKSYNTTTQTTTCWFPKPSINTPNEAPAREEHRNFLKTRRKCVNSFCATTLLKYSSALSTKLKVSRLNNNQ
jgi:hypothetical protein